MLENEITHTGADSELDFGGGYLTQSTVFFMRGVLTLLFAIGNIAVRGSIVPSWIRPCAQALPTHDTHPLPLPEVLDPLPNSEVLNLLNNLVLSFNISLHLLNQCEYILSMNSKVLKPDYLSCVKPLSRHKLITTLPLPCSFSSKLIILILST